MKKLNQSVISVALLSFLLVGMAFLLSGCGVINQDPEAKISVTSHSESGGTVSVNVDETVSFSGSNSEANGGEINDYDWDFKTDKSASATATGESVSYTYTQTGSYTVQLTVTDDNGGTDSTSITVDVGEQPLSAEFTVSYDGSNLNVDEEATFTASDTSSGNVYDWSFDYPTQSPSMLIVQTNSSTVTHTYTQTGSYDIRLSVEDSDGDLAISSETLEVQSSSN